MSGNDSFDGPPPRPSPPKRKPEPLVINAKANEGNAFGPGRSAGQGDRARLAVGAVGGVLGAALALTGAWVWAQQRTPIEARLTALEARTDAADAGVAKLGALESKSAAATHQTMAADLSAAEAKLADAGAALAQRLTRLEAAAATAETERKGAADATRDLKTSVDALSQDFADQRGALAAALTARQSDAPRIARAAEAAERLEARLTALEGGAVRTEALAALAAETAAAKAAAEKALAAVSASDDARWAGLAAAQAGVVKQIGALQARLASLETAAAAPKAETRVAPSVSIGGGDRPARAVAAMALVRRLNAGEPLGAELAALERLGAPPMALEPLKPFADAGAPSPAALARSFQALAPLLIAADRPAPTDPARRILGEVQGLVKIHKIGEAPEADAARGRVSDALAAANLDQALAAVDDLSAASLAAARDWRQSAAARLAADRAAEALVTRAVADLGAGR